MEFNYAVSTSLGVEEAVETVTQRLKQVGFGVLWDLDVPAKLKEKGQDLDRPVRILEVCKADKAKQALEDNIKIAYFLPCKVVVYQEGDRTVIGFVQPSVFTGFFPDSAVFRGLAKEMDDTLRGVMDNLAG